MTIRFLCCLLVFSATLPCHAQENPSLLPSELLSPASPPDLSPEEARKVELETLRAVADLTLLPPRLDTQPGPEYHVKNLDYGMTIGIERVPSGRLFAAWIGGEDGPDAHMLVAQSDDDGISWSEPVLVIDSRADHLPIPRTVIVGNLWTDPRGRLWLFFDQTMAHYDGRAGLWVTCCEDPDAETLSWTPPRRIWNGVALNKPIVIGSGEWLLFAYLLEKKGFHQFKVGVFPELDPVRGVNVLVSTDEGETWAHRGNVKTGDPDWHEAMAVEKKNGDLWMLIRTSKGPVLSESTDAGRTWTEPVPAPGIGHPAARFFLRKLASGRWMLVKHGDRIDQHSGRVQLSAWLSDDEGASWQGGLVLDERSGVTYPDGFQAPDGSLYVSYDWQRSKKGHILHAKFSEADILAGKLVTEGSRLKQPIMIPGKLNPPPE